jgi:hypothetical protein
MLPAGCPLTYDNLSIVSAVGEDKLDAGGNFVLKSPQGQCSFAFVVDAQDNLVAAAFDTMTTGLTVDASATAEALVMMFPIEWGLVGYSPSQVKQELPSISAFPVLVGYVQNLMVNDPTNLLNYQAHPAVLETAADVVRELLGRKGFTPGAPMDGGAYVVDIPGSPRVEVHNPKAVPYGISGYVLGADQRDKSSYFLVGLKSPMWADGKSLIDLLGGWVHLGAGEDVREYDLGDGSFALMLSKIDPQEFCRNLSAYGMPGNIASLIDYLFTLNSGDYVRIIRADARIKGNMAGMIYFSCRAIGIIPLYGDVASIVIDLVAEAANNAGMAPAITWDQAVIEKARSADTGVSALQVVLSLVERNSTKLAEIVFEDVGMARGIKLGAKFLGAILMVPDVAELGMFMWDLGTADQDIAYTIVQSQGDATLTLSLPPSIPDVVSPAVAYEGESAKVAVTSTDPDGDNICYRITFGDGTSDTSPMLTSGQSYVFSHTWERGEFNISIEARDEHGSSSAATRCQVRVIPFSGFYEDFDDYSVGGTPSSSVWTCEYAEPSRVMITDLAYYGVSGHSCKFIDFDPDIGDQTGYFSMIHTEVLGSPSTVQFSLRIANADDAFGVRTWGVPGEWQSLAYYVLTFDSNLCWVRYGNDTSDPNDFVRIMGVVPGVWYVVRLQVDWSAGTYDIYVNDQLKVSGATFIGGGGGGAAPYWQAVAFSDADCAAAYLDQISMEGAYGAIRPESVAGATESRSAASCLRITAPK